jgi:hypothetical protein
MTVARASRAAVHAGHLQSFDRPPVHGVGPPDALASPRFGKEHPMLDLWIIVLTLGLFGVAAGFVRMLERL